MVEENKTNKTKEEIIDAYKNISGDDEKILSASYQTVADTGASADRVTEIKEFCKKMGWKKIGIAFCKGLRNYGEKLDAELSKDFDVTSVCCNVCSITKDELGVAHLKEGTEPACNPLGQADVLNCAKVDLVVKCGFCLGHDILFSKNINAPCTTIIVKDRKYKHRTADNEIFD